MAVRKGTGFTNINRVLQANRGSRLGSTVAGGITGQSQAVQSGVQQSQQKFGEEADKNRLDNEESKQKREQILGRFDQNIQVYDPTKAAQPVLTQQSGQQAPATGTPQVQQQAGQTTPASGTQPQQAGQQQSPMAVPQSIMAPPQGPYVDLSKFKVSEGVQSQYDQRMADYVKERDAAQLEYDTQRNLFQSELDRLKKMTFETSDMANKQTFSGIFGGGVSGLSRRIFEKHHPKNIALAQKLVSDLDKRFKESQSSITGKISALESQYGEMTESEKNAFIESEKERIMAERAPTDEEIKEFTKYRTGTYTGPTELEDSASLLSKAQQTEQLGDLARSSGGRQEILRQFVGGRDYTQGQRKLDETILGQDQSTNLGAAARTTRGSVEKVQEANRMAGEKAKELTGLAKIFGEETRGMLGEKREGFSSKIDEQLAKMKESEAARTQDYQSIQDMLTSSDPKYKGWDKNARMGLALKAAADTGALSQQDIYNLTAPGGLIDRANKLGLDTNKVLAERIKNIQAQGLDRRAAANNEQEAILNALDKLAGRTGTDVEFGYGDEQYQAGKIGFDAAGLNEYLRRAEDQKALTDTGYGSELEQQRLRYAEQAAQGLAGILPGLQQTAGSMMGEGISSLTDFNPFDRIENFGENAAGMIEGVGSTALANTQMMQQGGNALMEGLMKLNIGGNSFAKTEAGKQMLKALEFKSMIENEALGAGRDLLTGASSGISELSKGNISQGLENILKGGTDVTKRIADHISRSDVGKVAGNIGREIGDFASRASSGFGAGKTGNWAPSRLSMKDYKTGKSVTIGSYANKSSSEIMNQIQHAVKGGALALTGSTGASRGQGYRRVGELVKYYQNAKAREAAQAAAKRDLLSQYMTSDENKKENIDYTDKDVQSFLDRLKPASYDYKDEVKDSPLASRDRQLGVMAQDLEKSELGKEAVHDTENGKIVDYKDLQPKMLASLAALNKRMKKLEGKE